MLTSRTLLTSTYLYPVVHVTPSVSSSPVFYHTSLNEQMRARLPSPGPQGTLLNFKWVLATYGVLCPETSPKSQDGCHSRISSQDGHPLRNSSRHGPRAHEPAPESTDLAKKDRPRPRRPSLNCRLHPGPLNCLLRPGLPNFRYCPACPSCRLHSGLQNQRRPSGLLSCQYLPGFL
ncbi:hypothetical protein DPX16_11118 [Anabarilius grahami]|uniref:Uncharacterized protein n=1 Tax=Anabarilius grahami TaxID=495550 RepID=A0A3N0Y282_ANAGA|nr:hypothetical protein DPX16_11118 [Anabarilius grahami]